MAEERLQKILARAGIASRRKAEELIQSGRVRVEGQIVTELGSKADTRAKIEVDGRRIEREQLCYGVLHKPRHMVTTLSDPEGRPTAQDILRQVGVRVVPVGRLDFNTSGALLFTNDGDFAQGLSHAKNGVPKVYVATVQGVPDERRLARWGESIEVEGKRTRPAEVRLIRREDDKSWIEVTIREGKNRQVRRLAEHAQSSVVRLSRISHAGISTEGLKPGEWRLLTIDELKALKQTYGVPEKIRGIMEQAPETNQRAARARPLPRGPRAESFGRSAEPGGERSGPRERGAARPERGAARPERGAARPERGAARPERDFPERGRDDGRAPRGRSAAGATAGRSTQGRASEGRPPGRPSSPARSSEARPARAGAGAATGRSTQGRSSEARAPGRPTSPGRSSSQGRPSAPGRPSTAGRSSEAGATRPPRGSASARRPKTRS